MGAVLGSVDDVPGSGAIAAFLRSAPPRSFREAGPCASQCAAIAERRLIGGATGFPAPMLKAPSRSMSSCPRPPALSFGPAASPAWCRGGSRRGVRHRERARTQQLSMS